MSLRVTADELDAGLALVQQGGLCELLPPFLEVAAFTQSWVDVRPVLERIDLETHEIRPAITLLGPKQKYVVRPVQLLDPVDTILYSAVVRRLAPAIEAKRSPQSERRVFSYRFAADTVSDFALENSWSDFRQRVLELCEVYTHVVLADIADFFPNVYLHRLGNTVAALGFDREARLLERWLSRWSTPDMTPTSYGLPVGQLASNLLSEALLTEVDEFLARDYEFVRYVDDYYIFARSQGEAFAALHALSNRLLSTERLHLNTAKTKIRESNAVARSLGNHETDLEALRDTFIRLALHGDPYGQVDVDVDPGEELNELIATIDAPNRLRLALGPDFLDLKEIGFALQVLGATGDVLSTPLVLSNLAVLGAASRQVANYLIALEEQRPQSAKQIAGDLLRFINDPTTFKSTFQLIWLLEPFTRSDNWDHAAELARLAQRSTETLVRRQALLGASRSRNRSLLLDLKATSPENVWLHRAALYGARYLPPNEREHMWRPFQRGPWDVSTSVNRAVIEYAEAELERESPHVGVGRSY
jgi:hypothetical protein